MKSTITILACAHLMVGTTAFVPSTTLSRPRYSPVSSRVRSSRLSAWSPFGGKEEAAVVAEPEEIVEELTPGPLTAKNAAAAAVWVGLITWAFNFAPGALGSDADTALVQRLITQPVPRPEEINELWFAVWNTFVVVPAALAALAAPSGRGQRLPAAPFLWGSGAFGYFALGPYFATRTDRSDDDASAVVRRSDLGWASRTIFENRIFGLLLMAVAVSIPFSSDLVVSGFDWGAKTAEYAALFQSSRFVAVASADIAIMSVVASVLVSEDCKVRGWADKSVPLLVSTLLLPVLGPCLYLAARPSLEE